jgi:hypothetical protein
MIKLPLSNPERKLTPVPVNDQQWRVDRGQSLTAGQDVPFRVSTKDVEEIKTDAQLHKLVLKIRPLHVHLPEAHTAEYKRLITGPPSGGLVVHYYKTVQRSEFPAKRTELDDVVIATFHQEYEVYPTDEKFYKRVNDPTNTQENKLFNSIFACGGWKNNINVVFNYYRSAVDHLEMSQAEANSQFRSVLFRMALHAYATINGRWLRRKNPDDHTIPEYMIYYRHYLDQYIRPSMPKFFTEGDKKKNYMDLDMMEVAQTSSFTEFLFVVLWFFGEMLTGAADGDGSLRTAFGLDKDGIDKFMREWNKKRDQQMLLLNIRAITPGSTQDWADFFKQLGRDLNCNNDNHPMTIGGGRKDEEGKTVMNLFGGATGKKTTTKKCNLQDKQRPHCPAASPYKVFFKPGPVTKEGHPSTSTRYDVCMMMPQLLYYRGADPHTPVLYVPRLPKDELKRNEETGEFQDVGLRLQWELQKITGVSASPTRPPPSPQEEEEEEGKTKKKKNKEEEKKKKPSVSKRTATARTKALEYYKKMYRASNGWLHGIHPLQHANSLYKRETTSEYELAPRLQDTHPDAISDPTLLCFMPRTKFHQLWKKDEENDETKMDTKEDGNREAVKVLGKDKNKNKKKAAILAWPESRLLKPFEIDLEYLLQAGLDSGLLPRSDIVPHEDKRSRLPGPDWRSQFHGLIGKKSAFRWGIQLRQSSSGDKEEDDGGSKWIGKLMPYFEVYRLYLQGRCKHAGEEEAAAFKFVKKHVQGTVDEAFDVLVAGCKLWLALIRLQATQGVKTLSSIAAEKRKAVLNGELRLDQLQEELFSDPEFWKEYIEKADLAPSLPESGVCTSLEDFAIQISKWPVNNEDGVADVPNVFFPTPVSHPKKSSAELKEKPDDADVYGAYANYIQNRALCDIIYPLQLYIPLIRPVVQVKYQRDEAPSPALPWEDLTKPNLFQEQLELQSILDATLRATATEMKMDKIYQCARSVLESKRPIIYKRASSKTSNGAVKQRRADKTTLAFLESIDWTAKQQALPDRGDVKRYIPGNNLAGFTALSTILDTIVSAYDNIPFAMKLYADELRSRQKDTLREDICSHLIQEALKTNNKDDLIHVMEDCEHMLGRNKRRVHSIVFSLLPKNLAMAQEEMMEIVGDRSNSALEALYQSYLADYLGPLGIVSLRVSMCIHGVFVRVLQRVP